MKTMILGTFMFTGVVSIILFISIIVAEIMLDSEFSFWLALISYVIGLTIEGFLLYIFIRFYLKHTDDGLPDDKISENQWTVLLNLIAILPAITSIYIGIIHAPWLEEKNKQKKQTHVCEQPIVGKMLKEMDKYRNYGDKVCP